MRPQRAHGTRPSASAWPISIIGAGFFGADRGVLVFAPPLEPGVSLPREDCPPRGLDERRGLDARRWLGCDADDCIFCRATLHSFDKCSFRSPCRTSKLHAGHGTTIFAIFAWHCGKWIGSEFAKKARPQEGQGIDGGGICRSSAIGGRCARPLQEPRGRLGSRSFLPPPCRHKESTQNPFICELTSPPSISIDYTQWRLL